MANNIKGITIEIGGNTTKLDKALKDVNQRSKALKNELKEVDKALKLDPKNTELLAQKQKILAESVENTKERLNMLKAAQDQARAAFEAGELPEDQYRALQREISNTEAELKNLTNAAEKSHVSLEKIGSAMQTAGGKIESAGKKMSVVSAGIVAAGGAAVAAAKELDEGYDTIIAKTGATGDVLEGLQNQMDNVFSEIPTDAEKAGTAIGEVNTRFQLVGDELGRLSKDFIEFSEINGTDLNNSIDKVDTLMTKFNVDVSQTGNVLGVLTKAGQDTGISMDTIFSSLEKNGAVMKEMDLGLVESINLLAQFEANGVDVQTGLAALKKAQQNATEEGKTLNEALNEQIKAIKGAETQTEALQIATDLFGKKGAVEMTQAIREGRFSVDDLSASIEKYGSVVNDTYNSTLDPWDQMRITTNNLKISGAELAATLLTQLQPIITTVTEKTKRFTSWFKSLDEGQKQQIIRIAAIVAAIGPVMVVVGKLISTFGKLTGGIGGVMSKAGGLMSKLGGLKGVIAALVSPVGIVVAALAALAAGFAYLYTTNDEFRAKVNETVGQVKEAFSQMIERIRPILDQLKAAFQNFITALQPVINIIMKWISNVMQAAMSAAGPIIAAVTDVVDFVTNIVNALVALLHGDFDGFFSYIGAALQNALSFAQNLLQGAINYVVTYLSGFGVNVQQIFSNLWNGIVSIFSTVGSWFSARFLEAYNGITLVFGAIRQWFSERWQDIQFVFSGVVSYFTTTFNNAAAAVRNAFSAIPAFFSNLWQRILSLFTGAGEKVATAFSGAFKAAMNGVFGTVENIVNFFVDGVNGILSLINEIPGVSIGALSRLSLPRLAKGGIIKAGSAIVAEAGPELISMVGGKAIVTPLTNTAKNQSTGGAGDKNFTQNNYYTSPKALTPYEAARQTRIATRNMILQLQKGGA